MSTSYRLKLLTYLNEEIWTKLSWLDSDDGDCPPLDPAICPPRSDALLLCSVDLAFLCLLFHNLVASLMTAAINTSHCIVCVYMDAGY